jgi:hypothetical protein
MVVVSDYLNRLVGFSVAGRKTRQWTYRTMRWALKKRHKELSGVTAFYSNNNKTLTNIHESLMAQNRHGDIEWTVPLISAS